MRFFFGSFRYSEDMDLDVQGICVETLRDAVIAILNLSAFRNGLKSLGIEEVVPPNIAKAKQTQTTQRFKVHLITAAGDDLFTKIEFSRRGLKGNPVIEAVLKGVLQEYKLSPLLVCHYDAASAFKQKIEALSGRSLTQARDIFDLYILSSQVSQSQILKILAEVDKKSLKKAYQNIFEVGFLQFKDSVLAYLSENDRKVYDSEDVWDEVKLKLSACMEELRK